MPSPILSGSISATRLLDHAVGLQPLDALPARRRGQADAAADLGDRERGVLLHHGEDLAVDGVHARESLETWKQMLHDSHDTRIFFLFVGRICLYQRKIFYFKGNRLRAEPSALQDNAHVRFPPFRSAPSPLLAVRLALLPRSPCRRPAPASTPLVSPNGSRQPPAAIRTWSCSTSARRSTAAAPKAYAAGAHPGRVHSDYDKAGWRVTRNGVPFMLPTARRTREADRRTRHRRGQPRRRRAGRRAACTDFGSAARVYWTLKIAGVRQGLDPRRRLRRLAGGRPIRSRAASSGRRRRSSPRRSTRACSPRRSEVETIEQNGGATLVDARPASFFAGKEKAPASQAYGHIPGRAAISTAPTFYDPTTNRLKPKAELAAIAATLPAGPVVAYCNTGHWAATDWFVLSRIARPHGRPALRRLDGRMDRRCAAARLRPSRTKWDDLKKALGLGS